MVSSDTDWFGLPIEIAATSKQIAEAGKYDDAIFAAFRYVESQLQQRLGSSSIGQPLIKEAFDGAPPRIQIGSPINYLSIQMLFSGALGHIRNDRGHNQPSVPCTTEAACISYLHFAALLLYLLSKDNALRPRVDSIIVHSVQNNGHIALIGDNLQRELELWADGALLTIAQQSATTLEAQLPEGFFGEIALVFEGDPIFTALCDARPSELLNDTIYEVLYADLTLFRDSHAQEKIPDAVAVVVQAYSKSLTYTCLFPTLPREYQRGEFLTSGTWNKQRILQESWYRDPITGNVGIAWNSSMLWQPEIIGNQNNIVLSGLQVLPPSLSIDPSEVRTLAVIGTQSIGRFRREVNLTNEAHWESSAQDIAFVKHGVVRAKTFGSATVSSEVQGFRAETVVRVEQHTRGNQAIYYAGLRGTQQICFDTDDNLYITNQSNRIYRLRKNGGLDVCVELAMPPHAAHGFDCIAIDNEGSIYVSAPNPREIVKFGRRGDQFDTGLPLAARDGNTKKSVAISSTGEVAIAVMGPTPDAGWVIVLQLDGSQQAFSTREAAVHLALTPENRVFVNAARHNTIDIFSLTGTYLSSIRHTITGGIGALLASKDGSLIAGGFHSGQLHRFDRHGDIYVESILCTGLGMISGLAMDSRGRLYSSDFATGRITVTY